MGVGTGARCTRARHTCAAPRRWTCARRVVAASRRRARDRGRWPPPRLASAPPARRDSAARSTMATVSGLRAPRRSTAPRRGSWRMRPGPRGPCASRPARLTRPRVAATLAVGDDGRSCGPRARGGVVLPSCAAWRAARRGTRPGRLRGGRLAQSSETADVHVAHRGDAGVRAHRRRRLAGTRVRRARCTTPIACGRSSSSSWSSAVRAGGPACASSIYDVADRPMRAIASDFGERVARDGYTVEFDGPTSSSGRRRSRGAARSRCGT